MKKLTLAWCAIDDEGFIMYQHIKPTREMAKAEFMQYGYKIIRVEIREHKPTKRRS